MEVTVIKQNLKTKKGGAALEYILVSTFAAVVTMGALAFVGTLIKKQLTHMGEKLGADAPDADLWTSPFSDSE
jgi:Flp pilus assembly pilin Flp